MDTSDKDINWDKLLAALEGTNTEPLTAEEEAMLKESREIQQRLATHDKFPVEEGWQRFTAARDIHKPKIVWWKPAWEIAAAAAVLAVVITAGLRFWKKEAAHQPTAIAQADIGHPDVYNCLATVKGLCSTVYRKPCNMGMGCR